jgi:hypothetical protein
MSSSSGQVECHVSRVRLLGLLVLTCLMVGTSYFCTTLPDLTARVAGWAGVAFFSLGFVAIPVMFFRSGPQVIVNEYGIDDLRLRLGLIPWEEIRGLSIGSVHSTKFLCIDLVDREKYLSRLPRWKRSAAAANEMLGFPALTIGFSGLSPGLKEVWAYIESSSNPAPQRQTAE